MMNISYIDPLRKGWERMRGALFHPFSLKKWLVIGFTAFLAGLLDGSNGSGSRGSGEGRGGHGGFREFLHLPRRGWEWLMEHPQWLLLIALLVLLALGLLAVLTWLSSRGKFMFLDNVVHDRAQVAKPWKQYRTLANSLFLWRLGFGLACLGLILAFLAFFFVQASRLYGGGPDARVPILFIVAMGVVFCFFIVALCYISLFLNSFVVPIMYKDNLSATRAWGRFLQVFDDYPLHFIFYGVFVLLVGIVILFVVIAAGLLTCCVGLLLLVIPYIGTVVTLPIWYTYRAFSLEYLAQFGPEFELFPQAKG